jgi:hydrogenase maturation factor
MRVLEPPDASGLAVCGDRAGTRHSVDVTLVEPVARGDGVLVHAAVALVKLEAT